VSRRELRAGHHGRSYDERRRLFILASGPTCWLCGEYVDAAIPYPSAWSPSIDLALPLTRGGLASDVYNWRLSHLFCNRARGNEPVTAALRARIQLSAQAKRTKHRPPAEPNWILDDEP
jgi:hypothetical protein